MMHYVLCMKYYVFIVYRVLESCDIVCDIVCDKIYVIEMI